MLNYNEKKLLAAYEIFFGKQYEVCDNPNIHTETQNMCYLLHVAGIEIRHGYVWDHDGPYSAEVQLLMRSIDRNPLEVTKFYEKEKCLEDERIIRLKERLEIDNKPTEQWTEILGSMAYIARVILPGSNFDQVQERLIRENPSFSNIDNNRHAWKLLKRCMIF